MPNRKFLITGANGFIGLRLVQYIKNMDFDIRILSRKSSDSFESIQCDFLKNIIPDNSMNSIDTVIHLAGFAHDSRADSETSMIYKKINFDATMQLANLAVKSGVKTFVFVSSVKAGGKINNKRCIGEIDQGDPEGEYGKSKRNAELGLLELGKDSKMNVVIVRSSLVYGRGMKGNLNLMLTGIKNGWFPPLPQVLNQRSMVHVDDLVRALFFLSSDKRARGEIFIVTDGIPYSSREIYVAMCKILGKKVPRWTIPLWVFTVMSKLSKSFDYKIDKLLGDEWYSSKKIESLGFKAKKSIINLDDNETFF